MNVTVYAGAHYGREHKVVSKEGRTLRVKHATGKPFAVNQCDVEFPLKCEICGDYNDDSENGQVCRECASYAKANR